MKKNLAVNYTSLIKELDNQIEIQTQNLEDRNTFCSKMIALISLSDTDGKNMLNDEFYSGIIDSYLTVIF